MSGCSEAALKTMKDKRNELNHLIEYYKNSTSYHSEQQKGNNQEEVALKENLRMYENYKNKTLPLYKKTGKPDYKARVGELNNSILEIKDKLKQVERSNKLINKLTKSNKKNLTKTDTQFIKLSKKIISCRNKKLNKKSTRKRCPNGTHKNKKSGNCEKK